MPKKRILEFAVSGLYCLVLCTLTLQARAWQVKPSMSLAEIQDVFDRAGDNDKVMFHKGVYDFSAGPFVGIYESVGAVIIRDKTLTVQGVGDMLIKGKQSELDSQGQAIRGLTAFQVINSDQTKDITFTDLKFETFMGAIITSQNVTPAVTYPCSRHVTIRDCVFSDIQRNGIAVSNPAGNVTIKNNRISAVRFGVYVSWNAIEGQQNWQSDGMQVDISNNTIDGGRGGIVVLNGNQVRILNNSIVGTTTYKWYGIVVEAIKTGAQISNNRIDNVKWGIDLCAAWSNNLPYPPYIEGFRNTKVENNTLTSISNTGIWLESGFVNDCRISNNRISLAPWGNYGISGDGYNNRYTDNVITGAGLSAVYLTTYDYSADGGPYCAAYDEYFANNSVAGFTPSNSHYYLDFNTHDNHVHGVCSENATVIDNGSSNEITCLVALGGATFFAGRPSRISGPEKESGPNRKLRL